MKLTLNSYIKIITACLTVYASILSVELGLMFLLFLGQFFIYELILKTKPKIYSNLFTVFVFTILIVYYLRALLLIQDTSFYFYEGTTGSITKETFINSMYGISLNTFFFFGSYVITILTLSLFGQKYSLKQRKNELFRLNLDNRQIFSKMGYITSLLLVLSTMRVILNLAFGIGFKGVADTSRFAFLARLAPDDFVIGISFTLYILFRSKINKIDKIKLILSIVFILLALLSTGSKSVVLLIIFYFFCYFLYVNRAFAVSKFLMYSLLLILVIPVSFYTGNAVKKAFILDKLNVETVFWYTIDYVKKSDFASAYDIVTNRFMGVDGYIAKSKVNSNKLYESFAFTGTIYRSIMMLVPLVEFDEVASGVAVGRVVEEHSDDVIHSGALGSYASLELMFKNTMFIGVILYGIVLAFASFLLQSIKSPFIKFIMFFFFSNFLLVATMSGNFDFSISLLLLKLALFKVYFYPVFSFNKAWRTQMSH